MRIFYKIAMTAAVVLGVAAPTQAQQAQCHPVSPTDRVVVTTMRGESIPGTLLCLTDEAVRLVRDGRTTETPLSEIRRIETRADPHSDGAVKGAAIPLVMWAIFSHSTEGFSWALRSAAGWAVIGGTWDALQTNKKTIYSGGARSVSVAWRLRF